MLNIAVLSEAVGKCEFKCRPYENDETDKCLTTKYFSRNI